MNLHIGRKKAIAMAVLLVLAISMLLTVFFVGVFGSSSFGNGHKGEYLRIVGQYSLDDGETWHPMGKDFDYREIRGQHDVTIKGHFTRSLNPTETIFIYTDNLAVSFKVNGYEVVNFGEPGTYPFAKAPGRTYLPVDYAHIITVMDKLEVHVHSFYNGNRTIAISRNLPKMFLAGYSDTLLNTLMSGGWYATVYGALLSVSGIYMLITILFLVRQGEKTPDIIHEIVVKATFGFFAICAGNFIITEELYGVMPLLLDKPVFCSIMSYLTDYGMVLGLSINYMGIVFSKRLQRLLWSLTALEAEFIIVAIVCQIRGIFDLAELRPFIFIFGIVVSLVAIPDMIYNAKVKGNKDSRNMLLILFLFLITAMVDIYNLYIDDILGDKSVSIYGVMITTTLQFYRVVHLARENSRRQIELARTKAELSETRITLLISQIQPHFLYNALNTIQYLCLTDAEKAAQTVEKFAKYLRGNMDSLSLKEPIEFEREIEHLENYLAIERLRFPDITFAYHFGTTGFKLPALTVQPLVENSIKYGVRSLESGGVITISTDETPDYYIVRVEDNGIGFDMNQKKNDGRSHVGMTNIISRVESMMHGKVTIDSAIGKGTRTTIVIPKEDKNESDRS